MSQAPKWTVKNDYLGCLCNTLKYTTEKSKPVIRLHIFKHIWSSKFMFLEIVHIFDLAHYID